MNSLDIYKFIFGILVATAMVLLVVVIIVYYIYFLYLEIDECATSTDDCEHDCVNTEGSFYCICDDGYRLNADNATCDGMSLIIQS